MNYIYFFNFNFCLTYFLGQSGHLDGCIQEEGISVDAINVVHIFRLGAWSSGVVKGAWSSVVVKGAWSSVVVKGAWSSVVVKALRY
jgi:hypothetical protein